MFTHMSSLSVETLQQLIGELRDDRQRLPLSQLKDKYITLSTECPSLFNYCVEEEEVDMELLTVMLTSREKLRAKRLSKLETDMEVSQQIAKRFLYNDTLKEPTEQELKSCKERLIRKYESKIN